MSCLDELNTYETVSYFALALTVVNIIAIRVVPRIMGVAVLGTSPKFLQRAAAACAAAAVLKIVLGVILLTVLYPSGCTDFVTFYPYAVIVLGILWLLRAFAYYKFGIKLSQSPAAQPAIAYATPVAVVGSVVSAPKAPYNSMA